MMVLYSLVEHIIKSLNIQIQKKNMRRNERFLLILTEIAVSQFQYKVRRGQII